MTLQVNLEGYPILCQSGIGPLKLPLHFDKGLTPLREFPLCHYKWCLKIRHCEANWVVIYNLMFNTAGQIEQFSFPTIPPTDAV